METASPLDWSLINSFLAVAELGSLSAAARHLGISQPTLGRHIQQAEAALQTSLFTRQPRGLALTTTGEALLPAAQEMRAAALRLSLTAAAKSDHFAGTVRITASRIVSHHILPPILARLRQEERILLAEQFTDAFAEPVDGGVFHLLLVAHLGFGHCLSHAGRRLGFGIAEKVDETVLHGAFGSPAPP